MSISNKGYNLVDYLVEEAMYYAKERIRTDYYPIDSTDFDDARAKLEAYIEGLEKKVVDTHTTSSNIVSHV